MLRKVEHTMTQIVEIEEGKKSRVKRTFCIYLILLCSIISAHKDKYDLK
jgi:hypothetical protein